MKGYIKVILLFMAVMMAMTACTHGAQAPKAVAQGKTSQYSAEYVKRISMTQPKLALRILQTAEDKKLMPQIDINALRSLVYFNSMGNYRKAITYLEAALHDPDYEKRTDLQQSLYNMASLEYYSVGQFAKSLMFAEKGIDLAYKHDNRTLVAQILTTMGQCHSDIGNVGQAIDCFDRVIEILGEKAARTPNWDTYYDLLTAYALKANCLLDMKRHDDLFKLRPSYEAALKKANALPEGINSANDELNATFYSLYAIGYEEAGQHDAASAMFDKLMATRAIGTPDGGTFTVPYLMLTHRYGEALAAVKAEEQAWLQSGRDTVDYNYTHTILMHKTRALQALGHYEEALATGLRAYSLDDSLARRAKDQNALWINEQLGKKMLNMYIGRQDKNLALSRTANMVMGALLIVCLTLMIYAFRSNKKIKEKNSAASSLITELLLNKRQLLDRIGPIEDERKKERNDDEQLHNQFMRMEKLIVDRGLFVQPKLERADVAKEMGMTTNDFNALFNRFSTMSFNNYINELRMERAAKLLKDKQNYTIEAIASECGVPVRQTFHRLFAKKFGMTPAEYRNS